MNIFNKLLRSRLVVSTVRTIFQRTLRQDLQYLRFNAYYYLKVNDTNKRTMSQKSITSFFKITPKKNAETKTDTRDDNEIDLKDKVDELKSLTNGKEKRSSKRLHSESNSDADSSHGPRKSISPVEKKKKVKRQRIESSGSESESSKSPDTEDIIVKKEKDSTPLKTYQSPKSKNVRKSPVTKDKTAAKKGSSPTCVKKEITVKQEKVLTEKNNLSPKDNKENGIEEDGKTVPEKVAEADYNPNKSKYHPVSDACWSKGEEVPYLALAKTLAAIEETSARLKMIEILSNYFRSVIALTPEDLLPSVYLCLNQLAPAYHSLELGIAETYLMKAIGSCTGRTLAQVRSAAAKCGELGAVAEAARATQRTLVTPAPLRVRRVFAQLKEVAKITGQASVNKKIAKIQSLYIACRSSEAKYLIRSLEGKLRIGLAEQSVLQALALASALTPPQEAGRVLDASAGVPADIFKGTVEATALTIKTTYCECPNYEALVPVLVREGVAALPAHCRLTPGVPIKPMLAHPTRGVHEILNRFDKEEFTCEWKYDGERAQLHVWTDEPGRPHRAAVFSRNQEDNTSKYPDIISRVPALLKDGVHSCVLDCEAVAYDPASQQILPFQVLSTRKRKDAAASDITVRVCVFLFDVLYLNGEALVRRPLLERRAALREHFNVVPGEWEMARHADCRSADEVQQCLEEAVRGSCEGLMVKTLRGPTAVYDIARRSHSWLKLKKDYLEGVGDTLDVVVVGGYAGRGKRAGLYGGFLLACYEPDAEQFQTLCKIGTGFSDEDLRTLSAQLDLHRIDQPRNYYRFDESVRPDAWFAAAAVWEVRCADLSLSAVHRAAQGLVDPDRGVSLRFPRFVRVREDKGPEQATSARQLADMYLAQDQIRNHQPQRDQHDFY